MRSCLNIQETDTFTSTTTDDSFKSKWSIGFECPNPVIFSPFRILTIYLIYKCYGNIWKKTTMTFAFKILKQMFLHAYIILCIFPIITFVIVPSKLEFISGFPYILLTITLTCEEVDQTVIITVNIKDSVWPIPCRS